MKSKTPNASGAVIVLSPDAKTQTLEPGESIQFRIALMVRWGCASCGIAFSSTDSPDGKTWTGLDRVAHASMQDTPCQGRLAILAISVVME